MWPLLIAGVAFGIWWIASDDEPRQSPERNPIEPPMPRPEPGSERFNTSTNKPE